VIIIECFEQMYSGAFLVAICLFEIDVAWCYLSQAWPVSLFHLFR